jgi:hypothetical protein
MKPISTLLALTLAPLATLVAAPTEAAAQPGYYAGPQPNARLPGGFHNRQGRVMWGGSFGLGGMNDDGGDIECENCDYGTLAVGVNAHIGGFVNPRLALMLDLQLNAQQLSQEFFVEDDVYLYQTAAMLAVQYWLTPQLYIKGGLGLAHLEVSDTFEAEEIDNGTAVMGALGFELFSSRLMSVNLEGRLVNGSYKGIDNNITAGTVGIGVSFF